MVLAAVVGIACAAACWCFLRKKAPINPRLRLHDGPDTGLPDGSAMPTKEAVEVDAVEMQSRTAPA